MNPPARVVLDTNVVSALRVRGRHPEVERWVEGIPVQDQYVTSMTIAEIERGIVALERTDSEQGEHLRRWFEDRVLPAFRGRVLSFDVAAARILATYRVPEHATFDDALIAATAEAAGMTIATRDTRHFSRLGVETVDPWQA